MVKITVTLNIIFNQSKEVAVKPQAEIYRLLGFPHLY